MAVDYQHKVLTVDQLAAAVADAHQRGETVVCCHGCFDIVHPGHLRYLQFARRQGNRLIVSVTGDAAIEKGANRPYIPQELRAENLAALELVDWVCIDANPTATELLKRIGPDVYVKGKEYQDSVDPRFIEERQAVEQNGGRVIFSSGEVVFSSTQLIESLGPQPELEADRLSLLCRRHRIDGAELLRVVKAMAGRRVVVVGDVLCDRYVFCDAVNVASESPMMSLHELGEERYFGGAAMIARHIAELGGKATLLCGRPDDAQVDALRDSMQSDDITFAFAGRPAPLVSRTRYLVDTTKLMMVERSEFSPLDTVAQREATEQLLATADGADAIIFCDFGAGTLSGSWVERAVPMLRSRVGVMAGCARGERTDLLRFEDMDLMLPTERELRSAVNDFGQGLASLAWGVMNKTRARHLVVTLGQRGSVVFDRQSQDPQSPEYRSRLMSEHLPALGHIELDRLGSEDARLALTTMSLAAGGSLMAASYLGGVASALSLRRVGNHPIHRRTLMHFLQSRRELRVGLPPEPPTEAAHIMETDAVNL